MKVVSTTGDYYDKIPNNQIINNEISDNDVIFNREAIAHCDGVAQNIKSITSTIDRCNDVNKHRRDRHLPLIANPKLIICGYVHNDIMVEYKNILHDSHCVEYAKIMDDYIFDSIYNSDMELPRVVFNEEAYAINTHYKQPIVLLRERSRNDYKPITNHVILLGRIRGFQKLFSARKMHALIHDFVKKEL